MTTSLPEGSAGLYRARARISAAGAQGAPPPGEEVDRSDTALTRCIRERAEANGGLPDLAVCGSGGDRSMDRAHARGLRRLEGERDPLIAAPGPIFGEAPGSGVPASAIGVIALPEREGRPPPRAARTGLGLPTVRVAGTTAGGTTAAVVIEP